MSDNNNNALSQEIEHLEHPFLKAPFECLNKSFRQAQKSVDKDLSVIEKFVRDLAKKDVSNEDACKYIEKLVTKLRGVKRRIEETEIEQDKYFHMSQSRIRHLNDHYSTNKNSEPETTASEQQESEMQVDEAASNENPSTAVSSDANKPTKRTWNMIRLNRILVDYLLRKGFYDTAIELAKSSDIEELVDIDIFIQSRNVINGLRNRQCKEALAWCDANKSKLKKQNSTLEFNLRLQEFIELVRTDSFKDAVAYARKFLSPAAETNFAEIKRAMAALAFKHNTTVSPYKELFEDSRWESLISQFQRDNYLLHSLTTQPILNVVLQAGLCALKTPLAYQEEHYNINDPLCDSKFQSIAEQLPFAHHTRSKLVCRITGQIMDEHNLPLALPNGRVYSTKAMQDMAAKNNGFVTDPQSGDSFRFEQLKKLYVL